MKTVEDIIDDICKVEGSNEASNYLTPHDRGGRTTYGISERAHPDAWRDGPPSLEKCKAIYREEYVKPWEWVKPECLRAQLIDFSVTSGPRRATYWLQRTMGITADGSVGPQTRSMVDKICSTEFNTGDPIDPAWSAAVWLLNNALVAARLKFIDELTDEEKSQKRFEEGWENRALSFLVLS